MSEGLKNSRPNRHGQPWSEQEDENLSIAFRQGASVAKLMQTHARSRGGIVSRLRKQGLIDRVTGKPLVEIEVGNVAFKPETPYPKTKTDKDISVNDLSDILGTSYMFWVPLGLNAEELHPKALHQLGLISFRVMNCLLGAGVTDIRQVFCKHPWQLKRIPNLGRKSVMEIESLRDKEFTYQETGIVPKENQNLKLIKTEIKVSEASLKDIQAELSKIDPNSQLAELKKAKRNFKNLKADFRRVERTLHKYEYGFDIQNTNSDVMTSNAATAQILINRLEGIIDMVVPDARSGFILKSRLGLNGETESQTLQQLADLYGISRERIRQLENVSKRRVETAIRHCNTADSEQLQLLCKSLFSGPRADAIKSTINFVQEYYGDSVLQIQLMSYYVIATGLFKSSRKAQQDLYFHIGQIDAEERQEVVDFVKNQKSLRSWVSIFQHCLYPKKPKVFYDRVDDFDRTLRKPNPDSIGRTGYFHSEKCQRNIHYESSEEYRLYQILEHSSAILWYREQPMIIPYSISDRVYHYFPDVIALTAEGHGVVIEVKPVGGMVTWPVLLKALASRTYLHEKGLGFLMASARGESLQTLSRHAYDEGIARSILDAISERNNLDYKGYKSIIDDTDFSDKDLYSLIIHENLKFQLAPFGLSELPEDISFVPLL